MFALIGPFLGAHVSVVAPHPGALRAPCLTCACRRDPARRDERLLSRLPLRAPFALQLWLFASPVAYPLSVVSPNYRSLYVTLNPAAGILDSFSAVLAGGTAPNWASLGVSVLGTLVIGVLGYGLFKRLEPNFADVI